MSFSDLTPLWEAPLLLLTVVAFTRLVGLRSFSKMSAYDFAITVAFGSTLASVVLSPDRGLVDGALAFVALFVTQWIVGFVRSHFPRMQAPLDNRPLLLMHDGRMLHENMLEARVTEADLIAKLRESGVLRMSDVRAVVFETTGDVSVLAGDMLEDRLLEGVRGSE
jgi:uncharacterized membrane protein YcaP (DUF421 family)